MTRHAPLILDIAGTALTAADRRRLRHPRTGGVILFSRNWHSRAQLSALCADIKALRTDVLICVDHEGGRVQRFCSDGFTHLPPMRSLGQLWQAERRAQERGSSAASTASSTASAAGYVLGAELRACGVDLSFAPVLDLDFGVSGVIGDRSFGREPELVAALAQSLLHGLQQAGLGHCGKHFPGHGFVSADSHSALPVDPRRLCEILAEDTAPYVSLRSQLLGVMPGHVIYPQVDALPAGFSAIWLQQILRGQLGFQGAIFSDDLSMAAARSMHGRELSYGEAALAALGAGCDLVLLCNQSLGDGAALDALLECLMTPPPVVPAGWQAASEARRCALLPQTPALCWEALMQQAAYQEAQQALRLLGPDLGRGD